MVGDFGSWRGEKREKRVLEGLGWEIKHGKNRAFKGTISKIVTAENRKF